MRRIRKRIEALRATADDQTTEEQHGDIRIVDNVEENRVQIFFPGTPSFDVRKKLKQNGFRWSPTAGAWQRHRSEGRAVVGAALLRRGVSPMSATPAPGNRLDDQGPFFVRSSIRA